MRRVMAGFKFNQMGKYLKDFGLYFRRKKPKRTEEDESTEDEKAFAGDARDGTSRCIAVRTNRSMVSAGRLSEA